ncbi:M20/M25/M40 family metallo-hydrolase [Phenylobacterium sp.]|uniref:M20/M25/M40 family metallo-hydrolase n=1 Tax=Phenylobacterium sp. TaxID=1871053 RepID=UPI0035623580
MGRVLALLAALIAAALIAWAGEQPPSPAPANAPATAFSAERAMADVTAIGSVPHPIGSAANKAVRDTLIARMTALGLSPQIHPGVAFEQPKWAKGSFLVGGPVENLVGVLPGRDASLPAMALMAHYDSVPASPGAADDAAGVASALEVVRAIKAKGVPARDVIVLITDGEEAGLLGARAFYALDPMARRIGFVFNMEARGAAGRVQMFQTGDGNGGAIDLLRRTTTNPRASSLTGFIYAHMPNDTDFTVSRESKIPGLNYAFLGHQFEYHSPTSTPATLDTGTLQDMGQQVLGPAQAVAFSPTLPPRTPDVIYSQVPGGITLAYPPIVGWLILAVAAGLIVLAVVRARRAEAFPWTDVARGAGAGLFAVLGGCAVLHFARLATGSAFGFQEQRFLLAQADRWEAAVMLLALGFLIFAAAELARGRRAIALVPLAAGLGGCAFIGFDKVGLGLGAGAAVLALVSYGRPVSRAGAWAGVLALGLVVATAVQALAPVTAFLFAWPLLLAALAAAASTLSARRGLASLAVVALFAALGVGWVGGLAHGAYLALDLVEILAVPLLLAALLLWPLAQPSEGAPPARLVGPALLVVGMALTLAVRLNQPYDARHPQVAYVGYHIDQDTGRAWRFSNTAARTAWADSVLKADGGRIVKFSHWSFRTPVDAAPARFIPEPVPQIAFAKQADGTLHLRAVPPPGFRVLLLMLKPDTPVTVEQLAGVPVKIPLKPGARTILQWVAAPQGLDLVLRPGGPGKLRLGYVATLEQWPAGAIPLPKPPADVMGFDDSGSTSLTGTRDLAW